MPEWSAFPTRILLDGQGFVVFEFASAEEMERFPVPGGEAFANMRFTSGPPARLAWKLSDLGSRVVTIDPSAEVHMGRDFRPCNAPSSH